MKLGSYDPSASLRLHRLIKLAMKGEYVAPGSKIKPFIPPVAPIPNIGTIMQERGLTSLSDKSGVTKRAGKDTTFTPTYRPKTRLPVAPTTFDFRSVMQGPAYEPVKVGGCGGGLELRKVGGRGGEPHRKTASLMAAMAAFLKD